MKKYSSQQLKKLAMFLALATVFFVAALYVIINWVL